MWFVGGGLMLGLPLALADGLRVAGVGDLLGLTFFPLFGGLGLTELLEEGLNEGLAEGLFDVLTDTFGLTVTDGLTVGLEEALWDALWAVQRASSAKGPCASEKPCTMM